MKRAKSAYKATHSGTCQVCGSTQKLPRDLLSLHGYTTEHGWFEGTCTGSVELPFELSKSLIDAAIIRTQNRKSELEIEQGLRARNDPSLTDIVAMVYLKNGLFPGDRAAYHWVRGELVSVEKWIQYPVLSRKETIWSVKTSTKEHNLNVSSDPREALNTDYARELKSRIAKMDKYIQWQQERIKDWKPCPEALKPVK